MRSKRVPAKLTLADAVHELDAGSNDHSAPKSLET
jgi:hypothetical protein